MVNTYAMLGIFCSAIAFLRAPKRVGRVMVCATACTVVLFVALAPQPVFALPHIIQVVGDLLGSILSFFVWIVGKLLILAIYLLTTIAQYNDFINSPAIVRGWVIVRDVANMFFIVILLLIAFATILNISSYKYQQMLPQLLISALLINFSKTIAGIFIDISQIVMLTFVNGFAAAAAGNFSSMFQLDKMFAIDPQTEGIQEAGVDMFMIVGGYLLALLMGLIALATVVVMVVILTFRIVMLWALVVLSPLPYLLRILPKRGAQYGQKWWDEFFNYLIVGPVLAFFLWLALVTMGTGNAPSGFADIPGGADIEKFNAIGSKAAKADAMLSFVISICMLIAGLKIAGELGVAGSGFANQVKGKIGDYGKAALKKGAYYGTGAAAARSLAARGVQSKAMQGALASASRIPLAGNLAVAGLQRVQAARKKREETATARVAALKATGKYPALADRTRQRWWQAPGRAFAGGYYEAEAAKKLTPSAIRDDTARQQFVQGMKMDDMKQLSAGELRRSAADMTDVQRLQLLQSGTTDQQQAVGLPSGYRSYRQWYDEQVEVDAQLLRAGGMGAKESDKEAKRRLRLSGRDVPTAPALTAGLGPTSNAAYMPGYTTGNIDTKYAAGHDVERQRRTREKMREREARGEDFFTSQEFRAGGDQFYAKDIYEENERTAATIRRGREERGEGGAMSGVRKTRTRYQQAFGEGGTGALPRVMLGANFADLGMEGMGAHLTGNAKAEVAVKIDAVLQREGYNDTERGEVREAVLRADSLDVINTGREAGSAKYAITHERTHGELERVELANPGALKIIWDNVPDRESIVGRVQKEWNNLNMSTEEVMHEYFTDGLSNASRNARAGGFRLPPEVLAQLKALGVKVSARLEAGEWQPPKA